MISSGSEQEAEELGYENKDVAQYVKQYQALDRDDRAAWRNLWMAEIQADGKKRTDKIRGVSRIFERGGDPISLGSLKKGHQILKGGPMV